VPTPDENVTEVGYTGAVGGDPPGLFAAPEKLIDCEPT
jgi:hypothetical protein